MKRISTLFVVLFLIISSTSYAQNFRVQSATITNNNIDSCSTTQVDVLTWLGCINWQQGPSTFVVSGDTIDVQVNYTSSFMCAGAISQPMFNVVLSNLPVKSYKVKATAYIDNVFANNLYVGNLDVLSCSSTGIINLNKTNTFSVYPNPTKGLITIITNEDFASKSLEYKLLDIKGKLIKSGVINPKNHSNLVNMEGFAPGLYFLKLSNGSSSSIKKITVY